MIRQRCLSASAGHAKSGISNADASATPSATQKQAGSRNGSAGRVRVLLRAIRNSLARAATLEGLGRELFQNAPANRLRLPERMQIFLKYLIQFQSVVRGKARTNDHVAHVNWIRENSVLLQLF
jgi:hypothetical protein